MAKAKETMISGQGRVSRWLVGVLPGHVRAGSPHTLGLPFLCRECGCTNCWYRGTQCVVVLIFLAFVLHCCGRKNSKNVYKNAHVYNPPSCECRWNLWLWWDITPALMLYVLAKGILPRWIYSNHMRPWKTQRSPAGRRRGGQRALRGIRIQWALWLQNWGQPLVTANEETGS